MAGKRRVGGTQDTLICLANFGASSMIRLVQAHAATGRKRHRFTRKYGMLIFLGIVFLGIVALVAGLMYVLSSPEWRARW